MTKRGHVYTPKKTAEYEALIRTLADGIFREPLYGPVEVEIEVVIVLKKAKTHSQLKDTRPDLDNYVKVALDALNKVAYEDDAQVVSVKATKWLGKQGEEDHMVIWVQPAGVITRKGMVA